MSVRTERGELLQELSRLRGHPVGQLLGKYLRLQQKAATDAAMTTADQNVWQNAKGAYKELEALLQIVDPMK